MYMTNDTTTEPEKGCIFHICVNFTMYDDGGLVDKDLRTEEDRMCFSKLIT